MNIRVIVSFIAIVCALPACQDSNEEYTKNAKGDTIRKRDADAVGASRPSAAEDRESGDDDRAPED